MAHEIGEKRNRAGEERHHQQIFVGVIALNLRCQLTYTLSDFRLSDEHVLHLLA